MKSGFHRLVQILRWMPSSLIAVMLSGSLFLYLLMKEAPEVRAGEGSAIVSSRSEEESRTINTYKKVNEGVVFITTIIMTTDPFDFFMDPQPRQGTGSGVIVDAERAIILTNLHVIGDAHKIEVTLANGRNYRGRLLGFDRETDLAVLQLAEKPKHLIQMEFGDSSRLEVGQRVLAIGNPFGLNRTLTQGIVSSLERAVKSPTGTYLKGLIQTDAAINPGNSGGALLDVDGRLIGINTAILSSSGNSAGIGFAIPANQIKRILPELIATGKVLRPTLGWILADTNRGPMVLRVLEGSPAAQAGIEPIERRVKDVFLRGYVQDFENADLIYKVNGKRVYSKDEVEEIISQVGADQKVVFTVRKGGDPERESEVKIKPELG